MADCTNAEEHGHAPSETSVGAVLRSVFAEQKGRRIITASFASHLHRIQQIADAAIANGRVVATLGLSMKKNVRMGRDLGVLHIPDASLIDIEEIDKYPPGQVCIISTGSQGEPMSALALLARGESKWVKVGEHDTVILSSHAIPGNEGNVNRVIDGLLRAGVEVVHCGVADVHATGHAQADELKTYLSHHPARVASCPIHGEYRHMVANAKLGYAHGRAARPRAGVRGRRRARAHRRRPAAPSAGCRPATCTSTASSATSARACCATARCWPRRAWWWWSSPSTSRPARCSSARRSSPAAGCTRPRPRTCSTRRATAWPRRSRSRSPAGVRDVESLERDVRRAAGKFVSERTKRRPMIVPVVMEA